MWINLTQLLPKYKADKEILKILFKQETIPQISGILENWDATCSWAEGFQPDYSLFMFQITFSWKTFGKYPGVIKIGEFWELEESLYFNSVFFTVTGCHLWPLLLSKKLFQKLLHCASQTRFPLA